MKFAIAYTNFNFGFLTLIVSKWHTPVNETCTKWIQTQQFPILILIWSEIKLPKVESGELPAAKSV